MEALFLLHDGLHGQAVELLVALEPGGLHGRPLGGVEQAEVDGRQIGDPAHLAAQGVHFLDKLALGQAADGGIAGHQGHANPG